ncbi:MAG: outer membrane beta-barrel protein [Bacteroidales bacterium]|nr:outer membrane beta-barrel protein [Bacteroidales bacterium]
MKAKWIFMTVGLLVSSLSFSQTEKGRFTLTGGSTLQMSSITAESKDNSVSSFQLKSGIGYFVANDVSLGMYGSYISQSTYSEWYLIPAVGLYYPLKDNFKPFAQVGLGYSNISLNSETIGGYSFVCAGGVAYFLNKNVSIDFGVQYQRSQYDSSKLSTVGGIIGFSIYL